MRDDGRRHRRDARGDGRDRVVRYRDDEEVDTGSRLLHVVLAAEYTTDTPPGAPERGRERPSRPPPPDHAHGVHDTRLRSPLGLRPRPNGAGELALARLRLRGR